MEKNNLIYSSIILILVILLISLYITDSKKINKNTQELLISKGKVEVLTSQLDSSNVLIEAYSKDIDSLITLSKIEPETRIIIKKVYENEKATTLNLSNDKSITFSTEWLSEADTLGK